MSDSLSPPGEGLVTKARKNMAYIRMPAMIFCKPRPSP